MKLTQWLQKLLGIGKPAQSQKRDFLTAVEAEDADTVLGILKTESERGNPEAMAALAALYSTGRGGVQQSDAEAALWYRQAAVRGYVDAQALLGLALATGGGVEPNPDEAAYWLYQAATAGHAEALEWLADLVFQVPDVIGKHFSSTDLAKLLKARGIDEMRKHAGRKRPPDAT
jgi:TPR repeat protein